MNRHVVTALAVGALLAFPIGSAGWGAFGTSEPNTKLDKDAGWMILNSDTDPSQAVRKVYFSDFLASFPGTTANPNVAALGTGFTPADYAYWAMLGVWKDCNKDGYVGFEEQGLLEYRSELLLDQSVCPKATTPSPIPLNWFPSHNDGQWVRELLPIQWYDTLTSSGDHNPYNVNDNGARVWLDSGLPGDSVSGSGCYINPQPTGTYRSTGGFIKWVDCFPRSRVGLGVTDLIDTAAAANPLLQPLSFSDDPNDQYHSHSMLNNQNPWGTESDASAAQAWDCKQTQITQQRVDDPTESSPGKGDGLLLSGPLYLNVSPPLVPPGLNQAGSAAGTANATGSGFDQCARNTQNNGELHAGDALAGVPYTAEGPVVNQPFKVGTLNYEPIELDRTNNSWASAFGPATPPNLGAPIGGYDNAQVPFDGQPYASQTGLPVPSVTGPSPGGDGLWFTVPNTIGVPPRQFYTTAYAYVDPAAVSLYGLTLPKGSSVGTYGQEVCGTFGFQGTHSGWDCDKSHWYKDANGQDIAPRNSYLGPDPSSTLPCKSSDAAGCVSYGALPGWSYNLRATNCYDQSAAAARSVVNWGTIITPVDQTIGQPAPTPCKMAS